MKVGSHSVEARKIAFFVLEQALLFGAFVGAALGAERALGVGRLARAMLLVEAASTTLAVQLGLYLADLYDFKVAFADAPRAMRLLKALGVVTILCGIGTLLLPGPLAERAAAVAGLGGVCTLAIALRAALPDLSRRVALRPRVLLVGSGQAAQTLRDEIHADGHSELVGHVAADAVGIGHRAHALGADVVVVAVDDRRGIDVRELLSCRLAGLDVFDAATFAERALKKICVGLARPSDLVYSDGFDRPRWLLWMRRLVSLACGLVLMVVALPILVVTALAIKLDSRGPVFYSQERVGVHGRRFKMLKFRTMRIGAESSGAVWAQKNDPRVTRMGRLLRRFRVDELPQLINVLKGDMGLVGPRPERPEFVATLRKQIPYYDLRQLVPPGITGWAQIRFPYAANLEEARKKLEYDLFYVKHLSVSLDLVILFHTAKVVLFGRGAR
jgi:sugar transferase (PEP-CTERM system associated)